MTNSDPCPCGRPLAYAACCRRWHAAPLSAPDAEALMRSRYSAYVLDLRDYLLQTWHVSMRPTILGAPEPGLRWLGLVVTRFVVLDEDHALVEFVARSKVAGRAHRLHEVSRFVREGGRWFYVAGDRS